MTTAADAELEFYEDFFLSKDLEPYPVQEEAFNHIFAGRSVLVTVPTGTGKTMMAKAGIKLALAMGRTAIYTTPLRALTEEKFRELCEDFGEDNVGFATGDYKVNPEAPVQVLVAEILWNRIYGSKDRKPADIIIMDEGHYFNDPERGYVWEQSIIGLHPDAQLVILSATVGYPEAFCQWVRITRGVPLELVRSDERKVPLQHVYREDYLVDTVKALFANGEYPALIFSFGRVLCFERARLLRSCPRFVTKEEQAEIMKRAESVLLPVGQGPEFEKLLQHGIGVHHAGVLPAYRRLVEELTADRLLKFVVTTETIAAGINLPAKRVVFPSLKKVIKKKGRLLYPAEYHQMAGRAGRPQFDTEGIAITLGPEEVIQEFRKEIRDLKKRGSAMVDEARIKQKYYSKARTDAKARNDVTWGPEEHTKLVEGEPAQLQSQTRITAEQILAIGLPDLAQEALPGQVVLAEEAQKRAEQEARLAAEAAEDEGAEGEDEGGEDDAAPAPKAAPVVAAPRPPPPMPTLPVKTSEHDDPKLRRLDIATVIEHLLMAPNKRYELHRRLAMITANLQALGVLDEHGRQIDGWMIKDIRGMDGPFVWFALTKRELEPLQIRELVELLVDHDTIQRVFDRREADKRRQWILQRLRERRRENPLLTFEDIEEEYWAEHPRELSFAEQIHQDMLSKVPHPELHGGKVQKKIWATMEDEDLTFMDYVQKEELGMEEGSLFTYLARIMKSARSLNEVWNHEALTQMEAKIRNRLAAIDERVLEGLW
ncbi:MAG: DEAD/DEAH box helicase [Myxococcales bacterium]|nr:DEAD/DEAH box helicase [Myxococcales bacterium]